MIFCFLLLHFLFYSCLLKRYIYTERGIFLYHVFALVVTISYCTILYIIQEIPFAHGVTDYAIILGVQGIYSLTFLECWSITQGGYSLGILFEINNATLANSKKPLDLIKFEEIGIEKQTSRIENLISLKLIKREDSTVHLTFIGNRVSKFSEFLANLAGTTLRE